MTNYWFLFNQNDGSIYGGPYLGNAIEWTNIPEGCGVIGAFKKDSEGNDIPDPDFIEPTATELVRNAFKNPLTAKVVDGTLLPTDYVAPIIEQSLTPEERITQLEQQLALTQEVLDFLLMGGE